MLENTNTRDRRVPCRAATRTLRPSEGHATRDSALLKPSAVPAGALAFAARFEFGEEGRWVQ